MNFIYLYSDRCLSINNNNMLLNNLNVSANSESQSSHREKSDIKTKTNCRSVAKYVRGAPSKFRRVLNTIRGLKYEEALMILEYMPYRSCEPILKCLLSSASNAKNNFGLSKTNLRINETYCDMGPVLKRYRPRAQGRG